MWEVVLSARMALQHHFRPAASGPGPPCPSSTPMQSRVTRSSAISSATARSRARSAAGRAAPLLAFLHHIAFDWPWEGEVLSGWGTCPQGAGHEFLGGEISTVSKDFSLNPLPINPCHWRGGQGESAGGGGGGGRRSAGRGWPRPARQRLPLPHLVTVQLQQPRPVADLQAEDGTPLASRAPRRCPTPRPPPQPSPWAGRATTNLTKRCGAPAPLLPPPAEPLLLQFPAGRRLPQREVHHLPHHRDLRRQCCPVGLLLPPTPLRTDPSLRRRGSGLKHNQFAGVYLWSGGGVDASSRWTVWMRFVPIVKPLQMHNKKNRVPLTEASKGL